MGHILVHAFRRDVQDKHREGIHIDHTDFYYTRYFQKPFSCCHYGVKTLIEVLELIKDTVTVNPKIHLLEAQLCDGLDSFDLFVKLTEEARQERQRQLDIGDSSVTFKFPLTHPLTSSLNN